MYRNDNVIVNAFRVDHGTLDAFGYRFETDDKVVVISGDTRPSDNLVDCAIDCDILIHEVYSAIGLQARSKDWQKYHSTVHTSTYELAEIADKVRPGVLVLYHQLHWNQTEEQLVQAIAERYDGKIVSGRDLDTF